MSPLYLLSVPISGILLFSKSSKRTRIIWGFFIIWVSMMASIPYTSIGGFTHVLRFIWMCLQFTSAWYGWTVIVNGEKLPGCLYFAVSGLFMLIFFPSSSWRTEYFKVKTAFSDTSMVWPRKPKSLLSPFFTWVLTGSPMQIKRSHRDQNFVAQSPHPLEMDCTVEL